ncbi:MAG TPA: hypothetical protein VFD36_32290 [Kofleriaceae bacterium]|nr:hypothetical protein [Kofleriaceae bacterium]
MTRDVAPRSVAMARWSAVLSIVWLAANSGCHAPARAPAMPMPPATPTTSVVKDLGEIRGSSKQVTWTCVGAACPWGPSTTGQAIVWPDAVRPISTRLGYTTSAGIYLPAVRANGAIIYSDSGTVEIHAGPPGEVTHRLLARIGAGHSLHVENLAPAEVLSVQGEAEFAYHMTLPPVSEPERTSGAAARVIRSTAALWRCNIAGCRGSDWTGAVIAWPEGTAHQSNGRGGDASRSVFSPDGTPLYPYMGGWANGCKVTAESGAVLIVEWERGAERWRETALYPGQSYVIHLTSPENGAMIESYESSPGFSVTLANCTPRRAESSLVRAGRPAG